MFSPSRVKENPQALVGIHLHLCASISRMHRLSTDVRLTRSLTDADARHDQTLLNIPMHGHTGATGTKKEAVAATPLVRYWDPVTIECASACTEGY